jgi:hypothetical protein
MDQLTGWELLPEIAEPASPFGSYLERMAVDALCARVLNSCLGTYSPLALHTLADAQSRRMAVAFQYS